MKTHRLPRVFMALVAAATAMPAAALPPTPAPAPPVRVELVDDATLAGLTGKFYGADMLTGVRIDLVSTLANAQGGTATASGALYVRRTATGFDVQLDARAQAVAGSEAAPATTHVAVGGEQLDVHGIGQITQIAGDGNRMGNLALIRIGGDAGAPTGFNGLTQAAADAGELSARISFDDGGVRLGLGAIGATIRQDVMPGESGHIVQMGQIAGNGITASNRLQLQMMTTAMPGVAMQQLGVHQALAAISGLRR
ncbi:hypothetical protein [Lysobacter humi (ex Lee et al. 2017)]